jgi:hypothetical protein
MTGHGSVRRSGGQRTSRFPSSNTMENRVRFIGHGRTVAMHDHGGRPPAILPPLDGAKNSAQHCSTRSAHSAARITNRLGATTFAARIGPIKLAAGARQFFPVDIFCQAT